MKTDAEFLDSCLKALDRAWRMKQRQVELKGLHFTRLYDLAWGTNLSRTNRARIRIKLENFDDAIHQARRKVAAQVRSRLSK